MSILRPKDGDYIVRGLFLLIAWALLGWVPFAVIGGILGGAGGATLGFFISTFFFGPLLFTRYLKLDPKAYIQRFGYQVCECGHTKEAHHNNLGCMNRWGYYDHIHGGPGCRCSRYRKRRWWMTLPKDEYEKGVK